MSLDEVADSPILRLIDRIFEMRREGAEILSLHIGEPDFETPLGIREAAFRAMNSGRTHYVAAQGSPGLRAAIADRLRTRHGIPARAETVVVVPAKFALYASLLATVGPGDEVLLPDPTYLLVQPSQLVGARPVFFPLREDFSFDLDAMARAITPRTRAVVLVSPSNPTGRLLTEEDIRGILGLARRHGLAVISDETYESLVYEGVHVAPAAVAGTDTTVITIGSFSKIYSMTGWRIGYAIAPAPIVARLVKIVEHTLTCVPPFIQDAAEWALANASEDEARFRATFRERRDHLIERLSKVRGLAFVRPQGAFYVFPKYDLPLPSVEFCGALLQEERVAVVPGIAFGPHGERHFRISYSSRLEVLDEAVARLERFVERRSTPRI
ncbi:MAG: pyridoxal phosphate-dependent aminotransferase [Candidatus Thermoplasmatota archaeon]|jgi:aspartate/methionine/tyrosine aminotransferase|nr:pyridoxal phosphate-dependent aminotransferase [Candidatus Thermoplasmatota archaeon]MCL5983465.1 pyridoxal phosphate-dependent aminotransferase [Candidatus Thermoplasmatota archaeon]